MSRDLGAQKGLILQDDGSPGPDSGSLCAIEFSRCIYLILPGLQIQYSSVSYLRPHPRVQLNQALKPCA